jgi:hypothetical protein
MRLEVVNLFDLAVEAFVDDIPDPCCGVRPPLLRNLFVKPPDEFWQFDRCLEPSSIETLLLWELVKLLFQETGDVFRVERLDMTVVAVGCF